MLRFGMMAMVGALATITYVQPAASREQRVQAPQRPTMNAEQQARYNRLLAGRPGQGFTQSQYNSRAGAHQYPYTQRR